MRKGEHFNATFSASPNQATTRLLQSLVVGLGYKRIAFDICTAYLWADTRKDERIVVRLPIGLRQYNTSGEELYCIMMRRHAAA